MPARSPIALKLLPSMTDFAFLLPVLMLFGRMEGAKTLLGDADTGWHIRTGEWILSHHQVPSHDFFSFSKPGEPWYAWEWLSDVLFAWLNSRGGLAAVVLASVVLLAATFLLLFRMARRKANPVIALLVAAIAAIISSVHWLARPHLFTLVFLTLFYGALERAREQRCLSPRALVILPAAMILWTNLHGGFFVGIVLIAAYGMGELIQIIVAPDAVKVEGLRCAKSYFLAAGACLAASLINPYSYHLHQHLLAYLGDSYAAEHIEEFFSLSFHHPVAIFFEFLLAAGAAAAFRSVTRGNWTHAVLLALFAHAALLASRNLPLYGIMATPIVAQAMDGWLRRVPQLALADWLRNLAARVLAVIDEMAETDAVSRWHLLSALGMLAVAALLYAPAPPRPFRAEYDAAAYPAAAVTRLRGSSAARIFTNDEWGDYLIYRLYPQTRVFVDGRSDFYGSDFEQKYTDVMNVQYGWEETLRRFGVDTVLLPPNAALTGALKESSRWKVVYDDGVALVFRYRRSEGEDPVSTALAGGDRGKGST